MMRSTPLAIGLAAALAGATFALFASGWRAPALVAALLAYLTLAVVVSRIARQLDGPQ